MWKDLKYLLAYIVPAIVAHALYYKGIWSYNGVTVSFIAIPILEAFFPGNKENLEKEAEQTQASKTFFNILLYLNVPMLLGILYWYFYSLANLSLQTYEIVGLTLSTGIYIGGVGINVAHELGHRTEALPRFLSKVSNAQCTPAP